MRFLVNFLIATGLVWMFYQIGWISIQSDTAPFRDEVANQLLVSAIIAVFFNLAFWVSLRVFVVFSGCTCGLGCFLFPVYMAFLGSICFWAIDKILPGWVDVNANPWIVALMGLMIAFIRWHNPPVSYSSSSTTTISSSGSSSFSGPNGHR